MLRNAFYTLGKEDQEGLPMSSSLRLMNVKENSAFIVAESNTQYNSHACNAEIILLLVFNHLMQQCKNQDSAKEKQELKSELECVNSFQQSIIEVLVRVNDDILEDAAKLCKEAQRNAQERNN